MCIVKGAIVVDVQGGKEVVSLLQIEISELVDVCLGAEHHLHDCRRVFQESLTPATVNTLGGANPLGNLVGLMIDFGDGRNPVQGEPSGVSLVVVGIDTEQRLAIGPDWYPGHLTGQCRGLSTPTTRRAV